MPHTIRSARGEVVDFELLAIKSQLAAKPVPKQVTERKTAIEEREGVKSQPPEAVAELMKLSAEAAEASRVANKTAPKRK
jgi:hypothetical protein